MRVADVQLSFPAILIALLVDGVVSRRLPAHEACTSRLEMYVLIFAIGISFWPQFARTVRGSTLVERGKEYVMAARVIGLSSVRIMADAHPAERAGPGAGDRDADAGPGDPERGDALLPRRGPAADAALRWAR